MQAISPVTTNDLLAKTQKMLYKFEVYTDIYYRADFLEDWSFRKRIDLPTPDDDLTDFPVEVPIVADADIGAECLGTGYDIRFTAADGTTLLPYERESFAVAGGEATGIFWVKSDVATTGTYIWLYYGNAAAGDVSEVVADKPGNIITNSAFNTDADWYDIAGGPATVVGGELVIGPAQYAQSLATIAAGSIYKVTLDLYQASGTNFRFGTATGGWTAGALWYQDINPDGVKTNYTFNFTPVDGDRILTRESWGAGTDYVDNLIVFGPGDSNAWVDFGYDNQAAADGGLTWGAEESEISSPAAWVNLCALGSPVKDYVKSISIQLGGAGMTVAPIAGSWSAEIHNDEGIFHPMHPSSPYATYFRIGRKVRISIGAHYGSTDYYWQRIIGYMDAPKFNFADKTISISGGDYMKALADCRLYAPDSYWGDLATFNSIASPTGTGTEIYAEADACEIGAGEANNVTNWTPGGSGGAAASVVSTKSSYALRLTRDGIGPSNQYAHNSDCGTITAGNQYAISFWGKISTGTNYARLLIYQTVGGVAVFLDSVNIAYNAGAWTYYTRIVTCTGTGAIQLRLDTQGKYATATDAADVDQISIKLYNVTTWMRYDLPDTCNGVYYVTLNQGAGVVPVWQGDTGGVNNWEDSKISWNYDEVLQTLSFNEDAVINAGTNNLIIYYYTNQSLINIVADILVAARLYASRALALAAMYYTDPSITIGRAWVETGTTALEAIRLLCERVNYRFWFKWDGTPAFKPAPVETASVFDLTDYGQLSGASDAQDLGMIKNHIIIEGIDQAMYKSKSDKLSSCLTASAEDSGSITTYQEQTENIKNHFFQDQASIDAAVAARLAEFHEPKWYSDVRVTFLPVPLELGDTITWRYDLTTGAGWGKKYGTFLYGDGTKYAGAQIYFDTTGIIRDISISNGEAAYKVEIAP